MFDRLGGAKIFLKLDFKLGYHKIKVKESDIPKTDFTTEYGHLEFLITPFGVMNALDIFMNLINRVYYTS